MESNLLQKYGVASSSRTLLQTPHIANMKTPSYSDKNIRTLLKFNFLSFPLKTRDIPDIAEYPFHVVIKYFRSRITDTHQSIYTSTHYYFSPVYLSTIRSSILWTIRVVSHISASITILHIYINPRLLLWRLVESTQVFLCLLVTFPLVNIICFYLFSPLSRLLQSFCGLLTFFIAALTIILFRDDMFELQSSPCLNLQDFQCYSK